MYRLSPIVLFAMACSDYDLLAKELDELVGDDTAVDETDPIGDIDTADSGEPDTDEPVDDPNRPVAVCSVSPNPVQPPFEAATWNGADSYDPSGQPLMSYSWTLARNQKVQAQPLTTVLLRSSTTLYQILLAIMLDG